MRESSDLMDLLKPGCASGHKSMGSNTRLERGKPSRFYCNSPSQRWKWESSGTGGARCTVGFRIYPKGIAVRLGVEFGRKASNDFIIIGLNKCRLDLPLRETGKNQACTGQGQGFDRGYCNVRNLQDILGKMSTRDLDIKI